MEYNDLERDAKEILSEFRFTHSLGVAKKAVELAKQYGEDEEIVKKVAIVHDIAKEMTNEELVEYANKNNIEIDEIESINPSLLHGKVGADIVAKKYNKSISNIKSCIFKSLNLMYYDCDEKILKKNYPQPNSRNMKN